MLDEIVDGKLAIVVRVDDPRSDALHALGGNDRKHLLQNGRINSGFLCGIGCHFAARFLVAEDVTKSENVRIEAARKAAAELERITAEQLRIQARLFARWHRYDVIYLRAQGAPVPPQSPGSPHCMSTFTICCRSSRGC